MKWQRAGSDYQQLARGCVSLSLCIVCEVMIHYVRKIETFQEEKLSDITGAIKIRLLPNDF